MSASLLAVRSGGRSRDSGRFRGETI
jgi:hypothetical protein